MNAVYRLKFARVISHISASGFTFKRQASARFDWLRFQTRSHHFGFARIAKCSGVCRSECTRLVGVTHGKDAMESLDAERAQRAGAAVSVDIKEGGHRVHHSLDSIVEHLTDKDEVLG